MTSADDGSRDDLPGTPEGPAEPPADPPLDVDAAWRAIVDNYGERAQIGSGAGPDPHTDRPADEDHHPQDPLLDADTGVTTRHGSWRDRPADEPAPPADLSADLSDAFAGDRDDDTEHFVPPEPPPLPRGTPARRLAWAGLLLPPALMLVALVLSWTFETWLSSLLVASFVGSFVFLVATMPRDGGDGWGDGAVV